MSTRTCAHCGQVCGDCAGGYGAIRTGSEPVIHLCHPNDPSRPDCYRRVTVYHEPVGMLIGAAVMPAGVEKAAAVCIVHHGFYPCGLDEFCDYSCRPEDLGRYFRARPAG